LVNAVPWDYGRTQFGADQVSEVRENASIPRKSLVGGLTHIGEDLRELKNGA